MEFVGGQPSENNNAETVKIWYRCGKCKHSALLTLTTASQAKKSHAVAIDREHCTQYAKEKTFTVGEHVYHLEWDDVGKVVRKDKMSNGIHSIVVSFEKLGERKLLENIQSEIDEVIEKQAV
jgi:phosphomevalonate kinase